MSRKTVYLHEKEGKTWRQHYKCDICDKLTEDAYSVSGIDFYPDELSDMGIDRKKPEEKK